MQVCKYLRHLLILVIAMISLFSLPEVVQAKQTNSKRVLLVYDSQNKAHDQQTKIAAVQRILTSLQINVKTEAAVDYQAGQLAHYQGVITLINWPQLKITNADFLRERQNFTGTQLHIGPNLTAEEALGLHATPQNIYQQQLILTGENDKLQQLLPFQTSMVALTNLPANAHTIGHLKVQSSVLTQYPYGTIVEDRGYMPYFKTGGYSLMLATKTIADLFAGQTEDSAHQPLLTITKVTPYSNLKLLDHLSQRLYDRGIPFAISTTTVEGNSKFHAFQRFAKVLRRIENRGGVIFLKAPVVGGVMASSGPELNGIMDSYIIQLAQNQVYPVGISASAYWNQDKVYRENALKKADQTLLLPDPATVKYAKQDNRAMTFKNSFYGVSATSFNTVNSGERLSLSAPSFAIPTALTFTMPNSQNSLNDLERRIERMNYHWLDPVTNMPATMINSGTAAISYRAGTYFLNGRAQQITEQPPKTRTLKAVKPREIWANKFFKTQGTILMFFFVVTFVIFSLLLFVGRQLYLKMFKH